MVTLSIMRPILLVGGAPRIAVDAVRFISVAASGATAVQLKENLCRQGLVAELLLGIDASPTVAAQRYVDREQLESALKRWIALNPTGVVVMSAAVNDYSVARVVIDPDGTPTPLTLGGKLPSRAGAVTIRLEPATKLIDQLRNWGLTGPIVGFKYEDHATVMAAAESLRQRVGAAVVVANSLCGKLQALIDVNGAQCFAERVALVDHLSVRLGALARG
jgi:phosphopantothenoylcysteine synthetase/decarboxylase